MKILVTGMAGFIGYHLSKQLVSQGHELVGIDNINDYYTVALKYARLENLGLHPDEHSNRCQNVLGNITFYKVDLTDRSSIDDIFRDEKVDVVCNLAAQAGVRHSLEFPHDYIDSNVYGFLNILEACKRFDVNKVVYASSSSVYGNSDKVPFETTDDVNEPVSLYAATKRANELIAHTYSHLYGMEMIGLRFFTVYGPWGRPDMAYFSFTQAILNNQPIRIFNHGELYRDFTYVDDVVNGLTLILENTDTTHLPKNRLYNIGKGQPIKLMDFIGVLEQALGKESIKEMVAMQPGDVHITYADTADLQRDYGYHPDFPFEAGINEFVQWYTEHFHVKVAASVTV